MPLSPQQEADILLRQWQVHRDLSPEERIQVLFYDFWLPPVAVQDARFEDAQRAVEMEMCGE